MNRFLLIFCFFIGAVINSITAQTTIHTYASQSRLAHGDFFKVRITENGVHKLTHNELRNRGIDPENVRMFGFGGAMLNEDFRIPRLANAERGDLPEIAIYDTGSAILFFAQGVTQWTFDASSGMFLHNTNPYSLHGYYFITSDNIGEKRRIETRTALTPVTVHDVREFTDFQVHERELHSITRMGREFFGERFARGTSLDIPFYFPNLVINPTSMRVQMNVVNVSTRTLNAGGQQIANNPSTFSLHLGTTTQTTPPINGNVAARYEQGVQINSPVWTFEPDASERQNFTLTFANPTQATAHGFLNHLTVNAQRELRMVGTNMLFHNNRNIGANSFNRYFLETDNDNIQIWDVTNQLDVQRIPAIREGESLVFVDSASERKSYVAIDPTDLTNIPSAELLDRVPNQNIHGMKQVDYLIITHPLFLSAAERLAQAHRDINGLRVGVVTTQQVYNEFSSGTPDATAYRWAAKMFFDRATGEDDRIRYLLLMGKGSFDNRGLFSDTGDNFVRTFQAHNSLSLTESFVTDAYFGLLADNSGVSVGRNDRMNIAVGRFPVRTPEDAYNAVDKTIRYMRNENKGAWKNELAFLGDTGDDNIHMTQANNLADRVTRNHPHFNTNKIMLDAFQRNPTNNTFPDARRHFQELLQSGLFFVNFMGHGNVNSWGNLFNSVDIRMLDNQNLPVVSAGTCDFSRFDREFVSAGEALFLHPNGGAIGVLSSARTVFSSFNDRFMQNFVDAFFALSNNDRQSQSVGTALMNAKNASFGGALGINTLSYIYFGCPAVRLNFPSQFNVLATEINGIPIAESDTLKALSEATVSGIIVNREGYRAYNFNGKVHLTVQDKERTITTLIHSFQYTDRPDVVFRGIAEVINGEFEITFMLPRNIRQNFGSGRFMFYAWDETNNYEAQGSTTQFIIGGINPDFESSDIAPKVKIYLNDATFVSGDRIEDATPIFFAHLDIPNGINTSNAPGRNIMLSINNGASRFNLNSYFQNVPGCFRRGKVVFSLPEQSAGKHILEFRVWDLPGNAITEYLYFEVQGSQTQMPDIRVYPNLTTRAYPNPASTEVRIQINYECSDIQQLALEVFDLQGRRIWSKTQNTAETISWNLTGANGNRIASGMYIYRIVVQTNNGEILSHSDKIIVRQQ